MFIEFSDIKLNVKDVHRFKQNRVYSKQEDRGQDFNHHSVLVEAAWLSARVVDSNAEELGSNPRLGLLNEFVFGDPRGKFTTLCK